MKLTATEKTNLLDILALIAERDMPSNNTEATLVRRSGLPADTVSWAVSVLHNDGDGWLDFDEHPKTKERGYVIGNQFDNGGDLDVLYASWHAKDLRVGDLSFDEDDEDPDDEWVNIDDDDEFDEMDEDLTEDEGFD